MIRSTADTAEFAEKILDSSAISACSAV